MIINNNEPNNMFQEKKDVLSNNGYWQLQEPVVCQLRKLST